MYKRQTEDLDHLGKHFPEIHKELLEIFLRLEAHYHDMCDTEFTIEQGKLWMLQTRVGKRTGAAALKMAVDMTKGTGKGAAKWSITKEEALMRVAADHLDPEGGLGDLLVGAVDAGEVAHGAVAAARGDGHVSLWSTRSLRFWWMVMVSF